MEWKPNKGDIPHCALSAEKGRYVGRINTYNGHITAMIGKKKRVAVAIVKKREIFTRGIQVRPHSKALIITLF